VRPSSFPERDFILRFRAPGHWEPTVAVRRRRKGNWQSDRKLRQRSSATCSPRARFARRVPKSTVLWRGPVLHPAASRGLPRSQARLRSRASSFRRLRAKSPRRSEPLNRPSHSLQLPAVALRRMTSSPSTLTVKLVPSPNSLWRKSLSRDGRAGLQPRRKNRQNLGALAPEVGSLQGLKAHLTVPSATAGLKPGPSKRYRPFSPRAAKPSCSQIALGRATCPLEDTCALNMTASQAAFSMTISRLLTASG